MFPAASSDSKSESANTTTQPETWSEAELRRWLKKVIITATAAAAASSQTKILESQFRECFSLMAWWDSSFLETEEFADLRYRVTRGFVEESAEYSLKPSREFSARGCREAGIRWGVREACVDDVSV